MDMDMATTNIEDDLRISAIREWGRNMDDGIYT